MILQKNPDSLIAGCNCLLTHLAASTGGAACKKTSFDVEEYQVDLYHFFQKEYLQKRYISWLYGICWL